MLIGLSGFKAQREKGYYVDKTEIIDELAERIDSSTGVIINRPRRFGKSLMLSMIDHFFNEKRKSRSLFEGLSIASVYDEFKGDLYPGLEPKERDYHEAILSTKATEGDYSSSLLRLCRCIERIRGKKPIVLIDEYDAPIERVFHRSYNR